MPQSEEFSCCLCNFKSPYDYYGSKPPFAQSVLLKEDAYVMKDPFKADNRHITIGSHCSVCNQAVCVGQDCSIFYSKRFCRRCADAHIEEFPDEIKQELDKNKAAQK